MENDIIYIEDESVSKHATLSPIYKENYEELKSICSESDQYSSKNHKLQKDIGKDSDDEHSVYSEWLDRQEQPGAGESENAAVDIERINMEFEKIEELRNE